MLVSIHALQNADYEQPSFLLGIVSQLSLSLHLLFLQNLLFPLLLLYSPFLCLFSLLELNLSLQRCAFRVPNFDEGMVLMMNLLCFAGLAKVEVWADGTFETGTSDREGTTVVADYLVSHVRHFLCFLYFGVLGFFFSFIQLLNLVYQLFRGFLLFLSFWFLLDGVIYFREDVGGRIEDLIFRLQFPDEDLGFLGTVLQVDTDILSGFEGDLISILIDVVEGEGCDLGEDFPDVEDECLQRQFLLAVEDSDLVVEDDLEKHQSIIGLKI